MAQITPLDKIDMNTYIAQRLKLSHVYEAYKLYPSIFSHGTLEIRAADPEKDYLFEASFADQAIIVTFKAREEFCNMIQCRSHHPTETCTDEGAKLWRSGEETVLSCQPGCFFKKLTTRKDNQMDSIYAFWQEDIQQCLFDNPGLLNYIQDPRLRSDKKWTSRVNTIPTGFPTRYVTAPNGDVSLDLDFNQYYCDEFYKLVSDDKTKCESHWWQTALTFTFLGSTIPQLIEMACDNNWQTAPKDLGLKPDTNKYPAKYTDPSEWAKNIDSDYKNCKPNIILSDLKMSLGRFERNKMYYNNREGIILNFQLLKSVGGSSFSNTDSSNLIYEISQQDHILSERKAHRRNYLNILDQYETALAHQEHDMHMKYHNKHPYTHAHMNLESHADLTQVENANVTLYGSYKHARPSLREKLDNMHKEKLKWFHDSHTTPRMYTVNDKDSHTTPRMYAVNDKDSDEEENGAWGWIDNMSPGNILTGFSNMLKNFSVEDLGLVYAIAVEEPLINYLKKFCTKIITKQIAVQLIFSETSERILGAAMESCATRMLVEVTSELVGRLAIMLAELSSVVLSVISVISIVGMILDLAVLIGFNPGGIGNEMTKEAFTNLINEINKTKKDQNNRINTPIDPGFFAQYILNPPSTKADTNSKSSGDSKVSHGSYAYKMSNYPESALILAAADRPQYYDDSFVFSISLAGEYLNHRTANSYGSRFDWSKDIITVNEAKARLKQSSGIIDITDDLDMNLFSLDYGNRQIVNMVLFLVIAICYFVFCFLPNNAWLQLAQLSTLVLIWNKFDTSNSLSNIWSKIKKSFDSEDS